MANVSQEELKKAELVAQYWARAWSRGNPTLCEDLFQEAYLGIMEARGRYNPDKNTKFSSYAYHWIRKYIIAYAQKNFLPISLPSVYFDTIRKKLDNEDHREDVIKKYGPAITYYGVVYSTGSGFGSIDGHNSCFEDDFKYEPDLVGEIRRLEVSEKVREVLKKLPDNERTVVELRFGIDKRGPMYFWQIGEIMGFSRQRAHQLYLIALDKIKKKLSCTCLIAN